MPFSLIENVPPMVEFMVRSVSAVGKLPPNDKPSLRVLDVGVGFGMWGFMVRQVLDGVLAGRVREADWQVELIGVEYFEAYISAHQRALYNEIHIGDATTLAGTLGSFDIVILGDVIEHFEKHVGLRLLETLKAHAKVVLVSTPNGFMEQGEYAGNDRERHLSGWTLADFQVFGVLDHRIVKSPLKNIEVLLVALANESLDFSWPKLD